MILMGDIDRGGVIAQIVGTQAVMDGDDNALIKGFCVNKFRGDRSLFDQGRDDIVIRTGWPSFGVLPWFEHAARLPAEDVMDLPARSRSGGSGLVVAVPQLPRIANFDDLDPLAAEPSVDLRMITNGEAIPAETDLILLVGSKSTIADLAALRTAGWDIDIAAHIRRGGHVMGLCGGYQMLGKTISDQDGVEGPACTVDGLGHLDVHTVLEPVKNLLLREGTHLETNTPLSGYEIHMGKTEGQDCARPLLNLGGKDDGAVNSSHRVSGCYLHGIFASDAFRSAYLGTLGAGSTVMFEDQIEVTLDALAEHIEAYFDLDALLAAAAEVT